MSQAHNLIIHKSEWDRLKRRRSPDEKELEKNDYLKSSIEQSQNWIKHWPDTVQGHIYQLKKQKQIEHAQQKESVKKFVSEKKQEIKMESIKKARDMIFEDSCYGRQLLGALLESKTLEEREQQILFQKYIKQTNNIQKQNESKASSLQNASVMEAIEIETDLLMKQRNLVVARINQAMAQTRREKLVEERERDKMEMMLDECQKNQLLEQENSKITKINLEKQLINEYEVYRKQIKKLQTKRDEEDDHKREIYRKHHDKIKNKEKYILNEIHKNKCEKIQMQRVFEAIKNINEDKIKKYNEFIEKGITRLRNNEKKLENAESEQKILQRNKRRSLDDANKILAEVQHQMKLRDNSKVCFRQSIFGNSCDTSEKKHDILHLSLKKNTLLDDLKKREKEPTPWNALKTTHVQFAQHASETLRQCRFKHMARKVINDYMKVNCLDEKSLSVPDY